MEPVVLRGEPAKLASLFGSGSGSGYGDGDGDGYGYGYGSGSGSGSGSGYGDGDGYGYGDGYGSGYGSGSGYGYGSGDGSGSGDGYGYGSGDGYGSKEYWCSTIPYFASKWPEEQRARYEAAIAAGLTLAFWRSTQAGGPANGGRKIDPAAPGVVHTAPGPLQLCQSGTLHATFIPPKWQGERWWVVAMHGEVIGGDADDKIGALKREILGEAL